MRASLEVVEIFDEYPEGDDEEVCLCEAEGHVLDAIEDVIEDAEADGFEHLFELRECFTKRVVADLEISDHVRDTEFRPSSNVLRQDRPYNRGGHLST